MYSAEDLFTEDDVNNDLIQVDDDNLNSGNEQQENENDSDNEQEPHEDNEEKKVVKPKRVVRNPQPKLNVQTLQGPKGLLCLEGHFKNKKYKGRGHEQEDLKTVMKTYEYWCHRLFPKLPFDDCLAKIESLGNKKPMQTYLKRIRSGLIFDEERPIQSDNEENQANDNQVFDELITEDVNIATETPQDDDQQLTEEQLERIRLNKERADRLRQEKLEKHKEALAHTGDYIVEVEETEEQLERIRVNKEKAERLRQERLKRNKPLTSDFIIEESSENVGLECESSNIEVENSLGPFNMDTDDNIEGEAQFSQDNELQGDKSYNLESAEGNLRNGEEFEDRLPEHESNDLIQQSTCESIQVQISKDPEPLKSKITEEIVQSDKENEVRMDCSS